MRSSASYTTDICCQVLQDTCQLQSSKVSSLHTRVSMKSMYEVTPSLQHSARLLGPVSIPRTRKSFALAYCTALAVDERS